jgi:hypothetical protein
MTTQKDPEGQQAKEMRSANDSMQRAGRICARWRERAAVCRDMSERLKDSCPEMSLVWLEEAQTLDECIYDLETEVGGN